jgi:hypothetical protein
MAIKVRTGKSHWLACFSLKKGWLTNTGQCLLPLFARDIGALLLRFFDPRTPKATHVPTLICPDLAPALSIV